MRGVCGVCVYVLVCSTIRGLAPEYTRHIRGLFQSEDLHSGPRMDLITDSFSTRHFEPFYTNNKEIKESPRFG